MEKTYAQPHDLISTKLSSQLPLTLPKESSIRLFGKEFGGSDPTIMVTNDSCSPVSATATATTTVIHHETNENRESQRLYECNYCNRNFSTSQALGGHQNAHRRERLQAKRAHIHNGYPNHHNRPLTATTSPPYHHQSSTIGSIINYNNGGKTFYGEKASYTARETPIYGRPLAASRFPTSGQKVTAFNRGLLNYSNTGSSFRSLYMHETKPNFNDQVSLDLHL